MYGNVTRKIITDSPAAWELTGVAKRLSFAVGSMNLPVARLHVDTPDGSVTVFRHGNMEIWDLKSGGEELLRVELISAGKSYVGVYRISAKKIEKVKDLKEFSHGYDIFSDYFSFKPELPYADITEESCVCVVPGAPVNTVANVSADNKFVSHTGGLGTLVSDHEDDWHYTDFRWVGYPYWFAYPPPLTITEDEPFTGGTLKHPGLFAANPQKNYHLSHSQITWGEQSRKHIIRHIDQEKRLYRPGRIDLLDDSPNAGTSGTALLMDFAGKVSAGTSAPTYTMTPFGKKPFTRDTDTRKVKTYGERVAVGGGATYTINGAMGFTYNMPFFFWPFIPYLWEIPYFNFMSFYDKETVYGRCIVPEPGSTYFRGWDLHHKDIAGGDEQTTHLFSDSAILNGRENVGTSVHATRPHVIWVGGYPVFVGATSGTWGDVDTNNWGYTANVTKTVPIGPVCNGMVLSVKNTIAITAEYDDTTTANHTKTTSLPDSAYLWSPSQPGWWPVGGYTDASSIYRTLTERLRITAPFQSEIKFGSTVIESGSGSMSYTYDRSYITTVANTITFTVTEDPRGPLPWYSHVVTGVGSGERKDNSDATGYFSRNIVTFAVLDYDSESNFKYDGKMVHAVAVVYKKITISHTLNRTRTAACTFDTLGTPQSGIISNSDSFNSLPREPNEDYGDIITVGDNMLTSGTRTVEYKVYANVGGKIYTKTLSTVVIGIDNSLSPSVSGQRVYGVVCKLQDGRLLVTYDLDDFVATQNIHLAGGGYDSPFNFEDWNYGNPGSGTSNVDVWRTAKRGIGIVSLDTEKNFGVDLWDLHPSDDEKEPVAIPGEVYSVSSKTVVE